jgi:hypothetical protein
MKRRNELKSFSDLPSVATQTVDATLPPVAETPPPAGGPAGEHVREMLRRPATAPPVITVPCHRWGLNE